MEPVSKKKNFLGSKWIMIIISYFGLYLLSAGSSWAIFSFIQKEPDIKVNSENMQDERSKIAQLPKTEECPINGKMYSKLERDIWEGRRPITAMIENHQDARPQSGLSNADTIYEAVAEGGITRFLAIFYCGAAASDVTISPIRSARVYFVNWAAGYGKDPLFVHIGGANNICSNCPGGVKTIGTVAPEVDAFKMLEKLGWRYSSGNDFDGGTNIGYPVIIRDQYRLGEKAAWEHSVVGFTDKIYDEGEKRGFAAENEDGDKWNTNFKPWMFEDGGASVSPKAEKISFSFWDGKPEYNVSWEYDKSTNSYLRFNGGEKHVDHENGNQLSSKNVLVMFVNEKGPVDKETHMFYTTIGKGKYLLFKNGDVIEGNWEKESAFDMIRFYDQSGKEIKFVRGEIWIEAVPSGNKIDY